MADRNSRVTIIGAGLSGLSTSYHIGHSRCELFEAKPYYGGHIYSYQRDGFTWDEGPHISFTKSDYVRDLLAESVDKEFEEFEVRVSNYFEGHWIDHPAQTNLYQVPEPLRTQCLRSFLESRAHDSEQDSPRNYQEWIHQAFGRVFADTFPATYTRKYWTTDPVNLGVDWIGPRVFYPSVEDVKRGFKGALGRNTHYFKKFRYPSQGGYLSYARKFALGARIHYGRRLETINFGKRTVRFSDRSQIKYAKLVSTIPLPVLIHASEDAPTAVREAAARLRCTSLLLVNVAADHPSKRQENWFYVYDKDKLSTRITIIEHLSPHNSPPGATGIQVEVYGSAYRSLPSDHNEVARKVQLELVEMGLLENLESVLSVHTNYIPWANIIFDLNRREALGVVNAYLDEVGVIRAGRYSEWKYHWTDDCILAGKDLAASLNATRGFEKPSEGTQVLEDVSAE